MDCLQNRIRNENTLNDIVSYLIFRFGLQEFLLGSLDILFGGFYRFI